MEVLGLPPAPGWGRRTYLTYADSGHRAEMPLHYRLIVMLELGF